MSLSYDHFERDLLHSDLVRCPPDDVSELIAAFTPLTAECDDRTAHLSAGLMPSVVLLNGPHARSNVRTATNRLLKRCLLVVFVAAGDEQSRPGRQVTDTHSWASTRCRRRQVPV